MERVIAMLRIVFFPNLYILSTEREDIEYFCRDSAGVESGHCGAIDVRLLLAEQDKLVRSGTEITEQILVNSNSQHHQDQLTRNQTQSELNINHGNISLKFWYLTL